MKPDGLVGISLLEDWQSCSFESIAQVYRAVGWFRYADDEASLKKAFTNSSYVLLALESNTVVGVLRSISDEVSVHYLQDILVKPGHQRRGIGRELLGRALKRFEHVRSHLLLTDSEDRQLDFYHSAGFENVRTYKDGSMNTFIKMNS
ncbi:MAG TPA: GNAT family N-acetyltransferase [Bacteriovoracaceae bacterium]|nr:GNAT family N-acetyltransferase [Bacteriovoracaceae bacterium]